MQLSKGYRKVVVDQSKAQSLAEAFSWPIKAKVNLEKLTEQIGSEFKPVLLADGELTVSSNFSGVCSQSCRHMDLERGAKLSWHFFLSSRLPFFVVQAHGFGKGREIKLAFLLDLLHFVAKISHSHCSSIFPVVS